MAKRRAPRHLAQLIVDDSADEDVKVQVRQVATAFRARLLSLPQREAIGDKRQLAAETLARRHDVVVHWCVRGRRHRCTAMQRCMPGHAPRRDDDDHYRRGRLSAQVAPLVVPGHTAGAADLSVLQHSTYYMLRSDRLLKLPQAKSGPHFGTLAYRSAVLADSAVRYSNTSMGEDQYFAERAVNHGFRAAVLDNNASHFTYVRHHNTWNFSMSAYGSFQVVQEVPAWFLPTSLWMRSHAHMLMSGPGAQARCMADMDAVQECRAVWGSWWEAAHGGVMYMAWCGGGGGGASWAARCTCPALESCHPAPLGTSHVVRRHTSAHMKWNVKRFGGSHRRSPAVPLLNPSTGRPAGVPLHLQAAGARKPDSPHSSGRRLLDPGPSPADLSIPPLQRDPGPYWYLPVCPAVPLEFFLAQLCAGSHLVLPRDLPPTAAAVPEYAPEYGGIATYPEYPEYASYFEYPSYPAASPGRPPASRTATSEFAGLFADYGITPRVPVTHLAPAWNPSVNVSEAIFTFRNDSACVPSFSHPRFVEYNYSSPCRRDCVLSAWMPPGPCKQGPACGEAGVERRKRVVLVPANEFGTCPEADIPAPSETSLGQDAVPVGSQGLEQVSACPGLPCPGSVVVEGQVTLSQVKLKDVPVAAFQLALSRALHMAEESVQVFRVEEALLDPQGHRIAMEVPGTPLNESDVKGLVGGVSYDRVRQPAELWARRLVGLSPSSAFHLQQRQAYMEQSLRAISPKALSLPREVRSLAQRNIIAVVVSFGVTTKSGEADARATAAAIGAAFNQVGGTFVQQFLSLSGIVVWIVSVRVESAAVGNEAKHTVFGLRVHRQPGDAAGLSPLSPQPEVHLLHADGSLASDVGGPGVMVHVALDSAGVLQRPADPKLLTDLPGAMVAVEEGVARFEDLALSKAAEGVRLRFSTAGANVSSVSVTSAPFSVVPGLPTTARIVQQAGFTWGGTPFQQQPVVALVDDAGNPSPIHGPASVSVELVADPTGGQARLSGPRTATFVNSLATFSSLSIDKAGVGFQLAFNISSPTHFPEPLRLLSPFFTVAVGRTAAIRVEVQPGGAVAGLPFSVQPQVSLTDAGGNVNVADSSSFVTARLFTKENASTALQPDVLCLQPVPPTSGSGAGIVVSVSHGDSFMHLSGDPSPENPAALFPIRHGDRVRVGPPWKGHVPPHPPGRSCPGTDAVGVVRRVRTMNEKQAALMLLEPWKGPTVVNGVLFKLESGLTRPVVAGVATFSNLSISTPGTDYRLSFVSSLSSKSSVGHGYGYDGPSELVSILDQPFQQPFGLRVHAVSEKFDVHTGQPAALKVVSKVTSARADGLPFPGQPVLFLVDSGDNRVMGHPPATVLAKLVRENGFGADLSGVRSASLHEGVARFSSLGLSRPGGPFVLQYTCHVPGFGAFTVSEQVVVQPAHEYFVAPLHGETGDKFAHATALQDDLLFIGAPDAANPARPVHVLRIRGFDTPRIQGVQVIQTQAEFQHEVQRISFSPHASASELIQLSWGNNSAPLLQVTSTARFISAVLSTAWSSSIEVQVKELSGSLLWDIQFRSARGRPQLVEAFMVADTSPPVQVERLRPATYIQGSFLLGLEPCSPASTVSLAANATATDVAAAVRSLLGGRVSVDVAVRDVSSFGEGARQWRVMFPTHSPSAIRPPKLCVDGAGLDAGGAAVEIVSWEAATGAGPTAGSFRLRYGEESTRPIQAHATPEEVEVALEELVQVSNALVSAAASPAGCLDIAVEIEPVSEAATLVALTHHVLWEDRAVPGHLYGTDATVEVLTSSDGPQGAVQSAGSPGLSAGSVHVFKRSFKAWLPLKSTTVGSLKSAAEAASTSWERQLMHEEAGVVHGNVLRVEHVDQRRFQHARFGASLAAQRSVLAVGAPGTPSFPYASVYVLECSALAGWFSVSVRQGAAAARFSVSAPVAEVVDGVAKLIALPSVEGYAGERGKQAPICGATSPRTVLRLSFDALADADLGLQVNSSSLIGGSATLSSRRLPDSTNITAADASVGAVYVFQGEESASLSSWQLQGVLKPSSVDLFRPSSAQTPITSGAEFGASVAIWNSTLVVGCPGDDEAGPGAGAVFVFVKQPTGPHTDLASSLSGGWKQVQRLIPRSTDFPGGDVLHCGQSLSFWQNTIAVACTGLGAGPGLVLIFRRGSQGLSRPFLLDQVLRPREWPSQVARFGASVSLHGTELVVGAPGTVVQSHPHLRMAVASGAAYLYKRESERHNFVGQQELVPLSSRSGSQVGVAVALQAGSFVAVGASSAFSLSGIGREHEVLRLSISRLPNDSSARLGIFGSRVRSDSPRHGPGGSFGASFQLHLPRQDPSRQVPLNATAFQVVQALTDLGFAEFSVNVFQVDSTSTGSVAWDITFLESRGPTSPLLQVSMWRAHPDFVASVERTHAASDFQQDQVSIWGKAGLSDSAYVHEADLQPPQLQRAAGYGSALVASSHLLAAGAPNWKSPTASHAGGAFVHDLRWMNMRAPHISVSENAGQISLPVRWCDPQCSVPLGTPGSWVSARGQSTIGGVHASLSLGDTPFALQVRSSPRLASRDATQLLGRATSQAGTGCSMDDPTNGAHLSNACIWMYTRKNHGFLYMSFDTEGASDFAQLRGGAGHEAGVVQRGEAAALHGHDLVFFLHGQNHETQVKNLSTVIVPDAIVEVPDEVFSAVLKPGAGIAPMPGGRLWGQVNISDDGDGGFGSHIYSSKVQLEGSRVGDIASVGNFVAAGEPESGTVAVFEVVQGGELLRVATLTPQRSTPSILGNSSASLSQAICGASVALACDPQGTCGDGLGGGVLTGTLSLAAACAQWQVVFTWHAVSHSPGENNWVLDGAMSPSIAPAWSTNTSRVPAAHVPLSTFRRFQSHNRDAARDAYQLPGVLSVEVSKCAAAPGRLAWVMRGTLAVGCPGTDTVHVFRRGPDGQWVQSCVLESPTLATAEWLGRPIYSPQVFGVSVAGQADGGLLVGAPLHSSGDAGSISNASSAAVYKNLKQRAAVPRGAALLWIHVPLEVRLTGGAYFAGSHDKPVVVPEAADPASLSLLAGKSESGTVILDTIGGAWLLVQTLREPTLHVGPHSSSFGHSVDLSGNIAVVGAPTASLLEKTTWNFETGDLTGWTAVGDAFQGQPTRGDNAASRTGYFTNLGPGSQESAGHEGSFYLSSFDANGSTPDSIGAVMGDAMTGVLTSAPFVIEGSTVMFRVGGGCDASTVSVQLLVDGVPAFRATGLCEPGMRHVSWDVSEFHGGTGVMRVVDDARRGPWGHIMVDEVRFSWTARAVDEAGAAYVWGRHGPSGEACAASVARVLEECKWTYERRLVPQDRRAAASFGWSVAASDSAGLVLAGSPFLTRVSSAVPTAHSFAEQASEELSLESRDVDVKIMRLLRVSAETESSSLVALLGAVKAEESSPSAHSDMRARAGATRLATGRVYVFRRVPEKRGGRDQRLIQSPQWQEEREVARVLPPGTRPGGALGKVVCIGEDGVTMLAASSNVGFVHSVRSSVLAAGFGVLDETLNSVLHLQSEHSQQTHLVAALGSAVRGYRVSEGDPLRKFVIPVYRHGELNSTVHVHFSTHDITARGVPSHVLEACRRLPFADRAPTGCGDYASTQGVLTFAAGVARQDIVVELMDDSSPENHDLTLAVKLGAVGGTQLIGPQFQVLVHIDDDDHELHVPHQKADPWAAWQAQAAALEWRMPTLPTSQLVGHIEASEHPFRGAGGEALQSLASQEYFEHVSPASTVPERHRDWAGGVANLEFNETPDVPL